MEKTEYRWQIGKDHGTVMAADQKSASIEAIGQWLESLPNEPTDPNGTFQIPAVVIEPKVNRVIPLITDPLGKHWDQPDTSKFIFRGDTVLLTQVEFDQLPEYSMSTPSGVYIGKAWKSSVGHDWRLLWYAPHNTKGKCLINNRVIVITDKKKWWKCGRCGNTGLQEERPHNAMCGGCTNPDWKLMDVQKPYIVGAKAYKEPNGEI